VFAIGEKIRIVGGAFEGFEGTIKELRPLDNRARVTISIYGRAETIELDLSEIKTIASN
jgi:transcription termination/antitermination protein NusG